MWSFLSVITPLLVNWCPTCVVYRILGVTRQPYMHLNMWETPSGWRGEEARSHGTYHWVQNLYSLPKVTATPRLGLSLHHQILYHKALSLFLSRQNCQPENASNKLHRTTPPSTPYAKPSKAEVYSWNLQ